MAISWPSISQASVPLSRRMTRGTRSLNFAGTWSSRYSLSDGGSTTWSSTLTRIRSSVRIRHPPGLVVPRLYIRAEYNTGRRILAEEILGGPGQRV